MTFHFYLKSFIFCRRDMEVSISYISNRAKPTISSKRAIESSRFNPIQQSTIINHLIPNKHKPNLPTQRIHKPQIFLPSLPNTQLNKETRRIATRITRQNSLINSTCHVSREDRDRDHSLLIGRAIVFWRVQESISDCHTLRFQ